LYSKIEDVESLPPKELVFGGVKISTLKSLKSENPFLSNTKDFQTKI
jgi:hypothetical protein